MMKNGIECTQQTAAAEQNQLLGAGIGKPLRESLEDVQRDALELQDRGALPAAEMLPRPDMESRRPFDS